MSTMNELVNHNSAVVALDHTYCTTNAPSDTTSTEPPRKKLRPTGLPSGVILDPDVQVVSNIEKPISWMTIQRKFNISHSWASILEPEFKKPYTQRILLEYERRLRYEEVLPKIQDIFSWTRAIQPMDIKVVILGQDPYHGPGQANGLAFSVHENVTIPPSLRNIYAALRKNYPDIRIGKHGNLLKWVERGVLLINTTLTVRRGSPGSHRMIGWEKLVKAILDHLASISDGLVFMLWGSHAQKACNPDPHRHLILTYTHPSPLSRIPFSECTHFRMANEFLVKRGKGAIDWSVE
ncbi:uracil-DNA glycosylase [Felid alphaherpesvirus 1]|uniref:Uracil-DNA glycosylase n=1 Tax=Feline herpesvirus 1 TaxID=10334 RepID=O37930_FHV1|nr:uracil-DNA glycosylase [Felid alphaherpesvirus 1]AMN88991.1 uracil-DNA glycosylase [synthetic construct]AAB80765.1 uracil-DNA glycosylase [Felid alphaherpesvirus 1]ALJ84108.1 uracil-DNA glycosylase [Felid alphaherpesvirus 1]ALJ84184.1 uracil-DNA glycosylase [Felid alphaherpesvirus 1]ALJ84260.1 uracil-DNA glycosylase [Felid alphaherpesvirus 1]